MTDLSQGFEAGTAGTLSTSNPPTSGTNSAFNAGPIVAGTGSGVLLSGDGANGTKCMQLTQTTTVSSSAYMMWNGLSDTTFSFAASFKVPVAQTSGRQTLLRAYDNTNVRFLSVIVTEANRLLVQVTNSDTTLYYAPTVLTAGSWYRVEGQFGVGTSVNATVNYYLGDSTTPVETGYTSTTATTSPAGSSIQDFRAGRISSTTTFEGRLDSIHYRSGLTPIGPWGVAAADGLVTAVPATVSFNAPVPAIIGESSVSGGGPAGVTIKAWPAVVTGITGPSAALTGHGGLTVATDRFDPTIFSTVYGHWIHT